MTKGSRSVQFGFFAILGIVLMGLSGCKPQYIKMLGKGGNGGAGGPSAGSTSLVAAEVLPSPTSVSTRAAVLSMSGVPLAPQVMQIGGEHLDAVTQITIGSEICTIFDATQTAEKVTCIVPGSSILNAMRTTSVSVPVTLYNARRTAVTAGNFIYTTFPDDCIYANVMHQLLDRAPTTSEIVLAGDGADPLNRMVSKIYTLFSSPEYKTHAVKSQFVIPPLFEQPTAMEFQGIIDAVPAPYSNFRLRKEILKSSRWQRLLGEHTANSFEASRVIGNSIFLRDTSDLDPIYTIILNNLNYDASLPFQGASDTEYFINNFASRPAYHSSMVDLLWSKFFGSDYNALRETHRANLTSTLVDAGTNRGTQEESTMVSILITNDYSRYRNCSVL